MDYDELVAKVIELLQREKRVPYRVLKRHGWLSRKKLLLSQSL